jgi:hypothetical protein
MSDKPKLSKREIAAGWTPESLAAYQAERNSAAADRIFDLNRDPITGKLRRPLKIERGPGVHGWAKQGYNPHGAWRSKRNDGDF